MSSTNRGNVRETSDYYVTPVSAISHFLDAFFADHPEHDFSTKFIFDPCAGGDSLYAMSYPTAINARKWISPVSLDTMDIREDSLARRKEDYLKATVGYWPDVIITNPPFAIAQAVIDKALADVKQGGLIIMLLRLNFFGSQSRLDWWARNMPSFVYVHSKRMGFTQNKKTDSIEYMHCVWVKGANPKFVQLRVI